MPKLQADTYQDKHNEERDYHEDNHENDNEDDDDDDVFILAFSTYKIDDKLLPLLWLLSLVQVYCQFKPISQQQKIQQKMYNKAKGFQQGLQEENSKRYVNFCSLFFGTLNCA